MKNLLLLVSSFFIAGTLQAQKLDLDQQKLATQILDKAEGKNIEKEKLATKIIQEGLN